MAKTKGTEMIPINGEALKAAISERGFKPSRMEDELGCGRALSNAIMRGSIAKPILMLLANQYGINPEDLKQAPERRAQLQPEEIIIAPQISEEQWTRIGDVIKAAILEALREV